MQNRIKELQESEIQKGDISMEVMREVKMKAEKLQIGDRIRIDLQGEKHTATAIRDEGDGMLFLLDEYLDEAHSMNGSDNTDGGYDASEMRKFLWELTETFPEKLRKRMAAFENGDLLRLLTITEMCGVDENFNRCEGQIECDSFKKWFIDKECDAVLEILRRIGCEFTIGNSIYPSETPAKVMEFCERRKHIDEAIAQCYVLKQELQYIISSLPVNINKYERLAVDIDQQIALYKGVRQSDNRLLKKKPNKAKNGGEKQEGKTGNSRGQERKT